MSKRTVLLILVLIAIAAVLIGIAVTPKNNTSPSPTANIQPTPTPVAQTMLAFSPNPANLSTSSASLDVTIDTQSNMITGVQIEIEYDPTVLTNVQITGGDFFTNPITLISNVDPVNGRASYAAVLSPSSSPKQGVGTVARLTFSPVDINKAQLATLTFTPRTLVTATGISVSVLKSATEGSVIIGKVTPTPTRGLPGSGR
jgi:hypothetical protein